MPNYDLLTPDNLKPEDLPLLIALYRNEPVLGNKPGIILALGIVGDNRVVDLFEYELTWGHAGEMIRSGYGGDAEALRQMIPAMGFLAAKSDRAFGFLVQATDPQLWKSMAQWVPDDPRDTYGLLASLSIEALGHADLPEARSLLEKLSKTALIDTTVANPAEARTFEGGITGGMFFQWVIREYGIEHLNRNFFGDRRTPLREAWKASEEGKKWSAWYMSRRR